VVLEVVPVEEVLAGDLQEWVAVAALAVDRVEPVAAVVPEGLVVAAGVVADLLFLLLLASLLLPVLVRLLLFTWLLLRLLWLLHQQLS